MPLAVLENLRPHGLDPSLIMDGGTQPVPPGGTARPPARPTPVPGVIHYGSGLTLTSEEFLQLSEAVQLRILDLIEREHTGAPPSGAPPGRTPGELRGDAEDPPGQGGEGWPEGGDRARGGG